MAQLGMMSPPPSQEVSLVHGSSNDTASMTYTPSVVEVLREIRAVGGLKEALQRATIGQFMTYGDNVFIKPPSREVKAFKTLLNGTLQLSYKTKNHESTPHEGIVGQEIKDILGYSGRYLRGGLRSEMKMQLSMLPAFRAYVRDMDGEEEEEEETEDIRQVQPVAAPGTLPLPSTEASVEAEESEDEWKGDGESESEAETAGPVPMAPVTTHCEIYSRLASKFLSEKMTEIKGALNRRVTSVKLTRAKFEYKDLESGLSCDADVTLTGASFHIAAELGLGNCAITLVSTSAGIDIAENVSITGSLTVDAETFTLSTNKSLTTPTLTLTDNGVSDTSDSVILYGTVTGDMDITAKAGKYVRIAASTDGLISGSLTVDTTGSSAYVAGGSPLLVDGSLSVTGSDIYIEQDTKADGITLSASTSCTVTATLDAYSTDDEYVSILASDNDVTLTLGSVGSAATITGSIVTLEGRYLSLVNGSLTATSGVDIDTPGLVVNIRTEDSLLTRDSTLSISDDFTVTSPYTSVSGDSAELAYTGELGGTLPSLAFQTKSLLLWDALYVSETVAPQPLAQPAALSTQLFSSLTWTDPSSTESISMTTPVIDVDSDGLLSIIGGSVAVSLSSWSLSTYSVTVGSEGGVAVGSVSISGAFAANAASGSISLHATSLTLDSTFQPKCYSVTMSHRSSSLSLSLNGVYSGVTLLDVSVTGTDMQMLVTTSLQPSASGSTITLSAPSVTLSSGVYVTPDSVVIEGLTADPGLIVPSDSKIGGGPLATVSVSGSIVSMELDPNPTIQSVISCSTLTVTSDTTGVQIARPSGSAYTSSLYLLTATLTSASTLGLSVPIDATALTLNSAGDTSTGSLTVINDLVVTSTAGAVSISGAIASDTLSVTSATDVTLTGAVTVDHSITLEGTTSVTTSATLSETSIAASCVGVTIANSASVTVSAIDTNCGISVSGFDSLSLGGALSSASGVIGLTSAAGGAITQSASLSVSGVSVALSADTVTLPSASVSASKYTCTAGSSADIYDVEVTYVDSSSSLSVTGGAVSADTLTCTGCGVTVAGSGAVSLTSVTGIDVDVSSSGSASTVSVTRVTSTSTVLAGYDLEATRISAVGTITLSPTHSLTMSTYTEGDGLLATDLYINAAEAAGVSTSLLSSVSVSSDMTLYTSTLTSTGSITVTGDLTVYLESDLSLSADVTAGGTLTLEVVGDGVSTGAVSASVCTLSNSGTLSLSSLDCSGLSAHTVSTASLSVSSLSLSGDMTVTATGAVALGTVDAESHGLSVTGCLSCSIEDVSCATLSVSTDMSDPLVTTTVSVTSMSVSDAVTLSATSVSLHTADVTNGLVVTSSDLVTSPTSHVSAASVTVDGLAVDYDPADPEYNIDIKGVIATDSLSLTGTNLIWNWSKVDSLSVQALAVTCDILVVEGSRLNSMSSAGDLSLTVSDTVSVAPALAAGGALSLSGTCTSVTLESPLTSGGVLSITLAQSGGTATSLVTDALTSDTDITLTADGVTIGGDVVSADGDMSLSATGSILVNGDVTSYASDTADGHTIAVTAAQFECENLRGESAAVTMYVTDSVIVSGDIRAYTLVLADDILDGTLNTLSVSVTGDLYTSHQTDVTCEDISITGDVYTNGVTTLTVTGTAVVYGLVSTASDISLLGVSGEYSFHESVYASALTLALSALSVENGSLLVGAISGVVGTNSADTYAMSVHSISAWSISLSGFADLTVDTVTTNGGDVSVSLRSLDCEYGAYIFGNIDVSALGAVSGAYTSFGGSVSLTADSIDASIIKATTDITLSATGAVDVSGTLTGQSLLVTSDSLSLDGADVTISGGDPATQSVDVTCNTVTFGVTGSMSCDVPAVFTVGALTTAPLSVYSLSLLSLEVNPPALDGDPAHFSTASISLPVIEASGDVLVYGAGVTGDSVVSTGGSVSLYSVTEDISLDTVSASTDVTLTCVHPSTSALCGVDVSSVTSDTADISVTGGDVSLDSVSVSQALTVSGTDITMSDSLSFTDTDSGTETSVSLTATGGISLEPAKVTIPAYTTLTLSAVDSVVFNTLETQGTSALTVSGTAAISGGSISTIGGGVDIAGASLSLVDTLSVAGNTLVAVSGNMSVNSMSMGGVTNSVTADNVSLTTLTGSDETATSTFTATSDIDVLQGTVSGGVVLSAGGVVTLPSLDVGGDMVVSAASDLFSTDRVSVTGSVTLSVTDSVELSSLKAGGVSLSASPACVFSADTVVSTGDVTLSCASISTAVGVVASGDVSLTSLSAMSLGDVSTDGDLSLSCVENTTYCDITTGAVSAGGDMTIEGLGVDIESVSVDNVSTSVGVGITIHSHADMELGAVQAEGICTALAITAESETAPSDVSLSIDSLTTPSCPVTIDSTGSASVSGASSMGAMTVTAVGSLSLPASPYTTSCAGAVTLTADFLSGGTLSSTDAVTLSTCNGVSLGDMYTGSHLTVGSQATCTSSLSVSGDVSASTGDAIIVAEGVDIDGSLSVLDGSLTVTADTVTLGGDISVSGAVSLSTPVSVGVGGTLTGGASLTIGYADTPATKPTVTLNAVSAASGVTINSSTLSAKSVTSVTGALSATAFNSLNVDECSAASVTCVCKDTADTLCGVEVNSIGATGSGGVTLTGSSVTSGGLVSIYSGDLVISGSGAVQLYKVERSLCASGDSGDSITGQSIVIDNTVDSPCPLSLSSTLSVRVSSPLVTDNSVTISAGTLVSIPSITATALDVVCDTLRSLALSLSASLSLAVSTLLSVSSISVSGTGDVAISSNVLDVLSISAPGASVTLSSPTSIDLTEISVSSLTLSSDASTGSVGVSSIYSETDVVIGAHTVAVTSLYAGGDVYLNAASVSVSEIDADNLTVSDDNEDIDIASLVVGDTASIETASASLFNSVLEAGTALYLVSSGDINLRQASLSAPLVYVEAPQMYMEKALVDASGLVSTLCTPETTDTTCNGHGGCSSIALGGHSSSCDPSSMPGPSALSLSLPTSASAGSIDLYPGCPGWMPSTSDSSLTCMAGGVIYLTAGASAETESSIMDITEATLLANGSVCGVDGQGTGSGGSVSLDIPCLNNMWTGSSVYIEAEGGQCIGTACDYTGSGGLITVTQSGSTCSDIDADDYTELKNRCSVSSGSSSQGSDYLGSPGYVSIPTPDSGYEADTIKTINIKDVETASSTDTSSIVTLSDDIVLDALSTSCSTGYILTVPLYITAGASVYLVNSMQPDDCTDVSISFGSSAGVTISGDLYAQSPNDETLTSYLTSATLTASSSSITIESGGSVTSDCDMTFNASYINVNGSITCPAYLETKTVAETETSSSTAGTKGVGVSHVVKGAASDSMFDDTYAPKYSVTDLAIMSFVAVSSFSLTGTLSAGTIEVASGDITISANGLIDTSGQGGGPIYQFSGAGGGLLTEGGLSCTESTYQPLATLASFPFTGVGGGGFGTGEYGLGGGSVRLAASTVQLDGQVTANGDYGSCADGTLGYTCAGGGSGGSVFIETVSLTGSGEIEMIIPTWL
ncbi:hypothetical protein KIPB_001458 [Kipferlia bialata]|uniref:Uncharacterized protein n=1 Tax=Kipferlia bialata TaxID=797122 RepID=A0A9K3CQK9_9EUKA|nr:hypothetical protein KIPB_001458 [Kipferlia bialata]|eukprot:g1458.t1